MAEGRGSERGEVRVESLSEPVGVGRGWLPCAFISASLLPHTQHLKTCVVISQLWAGSLDWPTWVLC